MLDMLKRHEIQVLRRAGHNASEVATLAGVSRRSVRRVEAEMVVTHVDTAAEIERRGVGRPAKAEPFRDLVVELLAAEPSASRSSAAAGTAAKPRMAAKTAVRMMDL